MSNSFDFEEFKAQAIDKGRSAAIRQGRGIGAFVGESAEQRPGKTGLSRIYENPEEVDPAGAELGTDGPATGHPVPGQVQDLGLTSSFVWSSLTILIT